MTTIPPRVSVVMPYLRARATIERAIDSVLSQTMADLELIAVSDGATDGSAELVASIARSDPRVVPLVLDANRGPSHARNRALDVARGEWVAVLDADDAFAPDRLERLLGAAGSAVAVVDNLVGVDPIDGGVVGPVFASLPASLAPADVAAHTVAGSRYNYGYLKPMVRRAFVDAHRLRYDESLRTAEDLVFLLECGILGGPIATVDHAAYFYNLQFSPTQRTLSATTHSVPTDRVVAAALVALESRHADRLDPASRAAIERRIVVLGQVADVSSFRYAMQTRRFADALVLLRSVRVRDYLWKRLRGEAAAEREAPATAGRS